MIYSFKKIRLNKLYFRKSTTVIKEDIYPPIVRIS